MTSPTARSLAVLRELGYHAQVVERFCPYSKRRVDLFGAIDIVGVHPVQGILAVQATSGTNHAARMDKARQIPAVAAWVGSGARFEVWSWAKQGPRGKRKVWSLRREPISLDGSHRST